LWLGAADATQGCARWLKQAQPGLIELGFAEESRPLHPHVTLARANSPAGVRALRQILAGPPPDAEFSLLVKDLTFFESQLGRNGATHRPLGRFPLGIPDLDASTARD
jgi:2'-5' RNA ligase